MGRLLIHGAGQYRFVAKEVAKTMVCFTQIDCLDDRSQVAVGKLNDIENIEYNATFAESGNSAVRL